MTVKIRVAPRKADQVRSGIYTRQEKETLPTSYRRCDAVGVEKPWPMTMSASPVRGPRAISKDSSPAKIMTLVVNPPNHPTIIYDLVPDSNTSDLRSRVISCKRKRRKSVSSGKEHGWGQKHILINSIRCTRYAKESKRKPTISGEGSRL